MPSNTMYQKSKVDYMALCAVVLIRLLQQRGRNDAIQKKRVRKLWARQWLQRRNCGRGAANLVFNELASEDRKSFKNYTRMSVETFEHLLARVGPIIKKQNTVLRECIDEKTRLLVTLRFLATGETFRSLHYSFRISVPALSQIIPEVVKAIYDVLKQDYLSTPTMTWQWEKVASQFNKMWNFPNCLGALDGKHIAFRAKRQDGSFYYNYKGFHSIVLLALVDAEYNFLYVDVGCNGRVSDGGVYNKSTLCTAIENNTLNFPQERYLPNSNMKMPYVIVADDAFRLTQRLLKPWGQKAHLEDRIFNYRLSRARRVVENAFGILANRFQILQKDIDLTVEKVQDITLTCCVLHNYIKAKDGKSYLQGVDKENTDTVVLSQGEWRNTVFLTTLERKPRKPTLAAIDIRRQFTTYFNTSGFVPWQWEAVKKFNF